MFIVLKSLATRSKYKNIDRYEEVYEMTYKLLLIVPVIAVLLGAIPSAMAQQSGYTLTVNITTHQFGNPNAVVGVLTASGYSQSYTVSIQSPSVTFNIPPNEGPSVRVCVTNSGLLNSFGGNCQTFNANGGSFSVNMAAGQRQERIGNRNREYTMIACGL
jgi:hypothetical protein